MKDPFGSVLTMVRDDPAVSAIVGLKVSSQAEGPPSVQIIDNASSRRPFGQGSGRLGLQYWTGFARCFGPDTPTGAVAARQLAGAVTDALDGKGVYVGSTYIVRSYAPELDGAGRDPDTRWPFYDVKVELYAAAQAVP